jgi:TetR/AcrR family transcriptional regulator, transcriptional repressor for nem operon
MARPKAFDPGEAMERAVRTFWERGYDGTSIQHLVEAMGINRASLYATYGDKEQLFLQVLDRYVALNLAELMEALTDEPSGRKAIDRFFELLLQRVWRPDFPRGCLMVNTSVESSTLSPAIARKVSEGMAAMETAFYQAVRRAQAAGELSGDKDPRALARYLTASTLGTAVAARTFTDQGALRDVVTTALSVL